MYGHVTSQIDQNLIVMQIMDEVSRDHGLACLTHEKPFAGVNGSGKHNNWSIATTCGTNLLDSVQLASSSGSPDIFPVIMAALVKAVNENGDLMRAAIATPGNDFRLGACEAPPAIISMYLGQDCTQYLTSYMSCVCLCLALNFYCRQDQKMFFIRIMMILSFFLMLVT